ncbi:hypothetical protein V6N13_029610 [Hibiscus sabdariffa]
MALRSSGSRKPALEILTERKYLEDGDRSLIYHSSSDRPPSPDGAIPSRQNRMKKKLNIEESATEFPTAAEDPVEKQWGSNGGSVPVGPNPDNYGTRDNGNVNRISYVGGASFVVLEDSVCQNVCGFGELRQRNVNGGGEMETMEARADESGGEVSSAKEPFPPVLPQPMANGNVGNTLQTAVSLGWKRVMAEDPNYVYTVDKSLVKYFLEEMHHGNSLRNTTTLGSEKERERVYDTIFRLPWRCEVLISAGFIICFDSFLSLLTIMPTRVLITFWRLLTTRQFKWPSAAELCDFGCFLVLACGVIVLGQIAQAITLSTCIVSHNNALFALLVSNNFAEIKSSVFKRFSKDNIHSLAYSGELPFTHTSLWELYVPVDVILNVMEPKLTATDLDVPYTFDIIKHSFLAKFNDIKPIIYSEFLEDLCKQTLNMQTEDCKKNLTFVPLAPACVPCGVEILWHPFLDFHDLYHAHKFESDDWRGTKEACNLRICSVAYFREFKSTYEVRKEKPKPKFGGGYGSAGVLYGR